MASSVDLPHPEGPAMARYSPFLICRSIWAKAWVSSSSVEKILLTPCILMSVPFGEVMRTASEQNSLTQPNAVESTLPGGHVGENDFVSNLEALEDFDGVDRSLAELDVDAHGLRAVIHEFE